jgi:hypothetical protein
MFFLLLAFSSYLLLIGPASAQVSAPNCTDSAFAWVGSPSLRHSFCIDSMFLCIVVQFAPTKSLPGHGVSGGGVQQWRSVHAPSAHRVRSYGRVAAFSIPALLPQNSYTGPTGLDDGDQCKCNTVVYNLISACDACQGEPWLPCVDQLLFSPGFQPINLLISYSTWSYNCTTNVTAGT